MDSSIRDHVERPEDDPWNNIQAISYIPIYITIFPGTRVRETIIITTKKTLGVMYIPDQCDWRGAEAVVAAGVAAAGVAVADVVGEVVVVVVVVAAAVAVEATAATRVPRIPYGPYPRYKTSPTRYSILGGRGTHRTRTNAQFWI